MLSKRQVFGQQDRNLIPTSVLLTVINVLLVRSLPSGRMTDENLSSRKENKASASTPPAPVHLPDPLSQWGMIRTHRKDSGATGGH